MAYLGVSYQLIGQKAPFLALLDQYEFDKLRFVLAPVLFVGAVLLLVPRTTRIGILALAFASLGIGLGTWDHIQSWDAATYFAIILTFGPFLFLLYFLTSHTA